MSLILEQAFQLPGAPREGSIFVVFNVTRGQVDLPGDRPELRPTADRNVIEVLLDQLPVPDGDANRWLELRSLEEELDLVGYAYSTPTGGSVLMYPLHRFLPHADSSEFLLRYSPKPAKEAWLNPARYRAELQGHLALAPSTRVSEYKRFFFELELWSNPVLAGTGFLITMVEDVTRCLKQRIRARARAVAQADAPAMTDLLAREKALGDLVAQDRQSLKDITEKMLETIRASLARLAALPGLDGASALQCFREGFAMFANGELRTLLQSMAYTTEPSSDFFFLFGEFMLMAHDHVALLRDTHDEGTPERARLEADLALCVEVAAVMTWTQRIFTVVYEPKGPDEQGFFAYHAKHFGQSLAPSNKASIQSTFLAEFGDPPSIDALRMASASHALESKTKLLYDGPAA